MPDDLRSFMELLDIPPEPGDVEGNPAEAGDGEGNRPGEGTSDELAAGLLLWGLIFFCMPWPPEFGAGNP